MKRLFLVGGVLAAFFSTVWLYGLSLAPGPAPALLIVVGIFAPAAMAFAAVMVIDAATPPTDREAAARRAEWKAIEATAQKRMEINR